MQDEQKHQQARIEAGVQFEKIKLDMLQVRMQNQLNEQVEIAEIAKSDAKLLDVSANLFLTWCLVSVVCSRWS